MRVSSVASEAVQGLRRNLVMSVAAVVTVAISLTFVGGALLIRLTVDRLEDALYRDLTVSIFLNDGITDPQRQEVAQVLSGTPYVEEVTYESKEEAFRRFKLQNPNDPDLIANVTADALPESYRVELSDPEQYEVVASAVQGLPAVDEVVDFREFLESLFGILGGLRNFALATAGVQIIAATLLIANTVRVTAFSRRRETGVMRLVGATRWYIQLPFLVEGLVIGLLGTAIGVGLLAAGKWALLDGQLEELFRNGIIQNPSYTDIVLGQGPWLLALGLGISAVTSLLALQRYVRV